MRILHIYKDYDPIIGGIENHIGVLARAQAAGGHDVTVLVCDPGGLAGRECRDGVEIIRAPRLATILSMPISVRQPLIARRQPCDLIHVHSPYPLGEISALAAGQSSALVITYHSDILRQKISLALYAPMLRRVLNTADGIIATSPPYVDSSRWLAPVRDKCRVIPLGVDERRFVPEEAYPSGPASLLFVGKLRHYKGVDVLLRAMSGLPGVCLDVVGDGPMRASWEALSADLGLTDRVRFAGEIEGAGLPARYRRARVFVLPSTNRAEAFGTVLLEAMASGLPCVTTSVGTGSSWVVEDGLTGSVVAPGDVAALTGALGRLVARPEYAAELGRAGRLRVEERFTESAMTRATEAYYRDLVAGSTGRSSEAGS